MIKKYIGRKFLAALIDYAIIFTITSYVILIFGEQSKTEPETYELTGFPSLIIIVPWLIFTVCFEYFFGSTLGNGIVRLKPIGENGNLKISLLQSFQRHLLDPIDMIFFGLVGYLVMNSNQKGQRLGDIFAKTIVVKI